MKIAFISIMTRLPWGGSEVLWSEAAKAALDDGHQVMASVFHWSKDQPVIRQLVQSGMQLHTRRRWHLPDFAQKIVNRLTGEAYHRKWWPAPYKAIERFDPDLICVSQGGSIDVAFDGVQRLLLESGKPFFVISQQNFEHKLYSLRLIAPLQKIYQKAACLFFVSERNWEVLQRQVCMKLPNGSVVANPVNLKEKKRLPFPAYEGGGDGTVHIACVGRLECEAKGQDILVQVLSSEEWKNRKWVLNFYGKGHHEAYLRLLGEQFGIGERMSFKGHVNDIAEIWRHNHLLVMPSLREGTPLALIEAMACGRPSVVTDVGGNADYCIEGETGFLAEAPNVKYFGNALERAWKAKPEWEKIGENAHEFYIHNTDTEPGKSLLRKMLEAVEANPG